MKTIIRSDYQKFVDKIERDFPSVKVSSLVVIELRYWFITYRIIGILIKLDGVIGIDIEHIETTETGPPTLYFNVVDADFNELIKAYDIVYQLFWMAYEGKFQALEIKPIEDIEVNWL